jgi:Uma2 family endonuclease
MGLPIRRRDFETTEDFLAWEGSQTERHEFVDGEVFPAHAMVGARRIHVDVAGNCYALLKSALRGTSCRPYLLDLKLKVAEDIFYPDVLVTCHPDDLVADMVVQHPKVIIEVLSESTAAYDRGRKFAAYRRIAALTEYALIDPEARTIEVYRRTEADDWLLAASEAPRGLVLRSLDFVATREAVFENLPD